MAMLAKQGWRLLHNLDSLCARVIKAKYYPGSDVLSACPSGNMSYTWRSILKGLDVLKKGIIWRIGYGSKMIYGVIPGCQGSGQGCQLHLEGIRC
jgi:hypothetical protein